MRAADVEKLSVEFYLATHLTLERVLSFPSNRATLLAGQGDIEEHVVRRMFVDTVEAMKEELDDCDSLRAAREKMAKRMEGGKWKVSMVDWFLEEGEERVELARGNYEGVEPGVTAGEWEAEKKVLGMLKGKLAGAIERWDGDEKGAEMCRILLEKVGDGGMGIGV